MGTAVPCAYVCMQSSDRVSVSVKCVVWRLTRCCSCNEYFPFTRDSWGGGGGGGSVNWMDPNAAAAGDPSAAFWTAYCQQYYQMMGGLSAIPGVPGQPAMPGMPGPPGMQPGMQPGMPVPGMPNNMYMGNPGGLGQEPAPPTQPMDPNAASYYYNAANNPNQPVPASAEAVQTTEDGGQDFSRAWIVYYRSVGMHKEADDLEATLKAKENGGR